MERRLRLVLFLGVLFVAHPVLSQTIACGETKQSSAEAGHNVTAWYYFSATEGEVFSRVCSRLTRESHSLVGHL